MTGTLILLPRFDACGAASSASWPASTKTAPDTAPSIRALISPDLCGTDEYGTPAEAAAINANAGVREYCEAQHERQQRLGAEFGRPGIISAASPPRNTTS
ncbi:class I tRNA ligase family protein [Nocardia sp. NPDC004085]